MLDLNDLRHFLAVARTGSTLGAAKALCVNQTTVARRIAELEQAVGAQLFDRHREGYRLRADAEALVAIAERAEAEAAAFADFAAALGRGVDHLRVTTNEPLANSVLAPAVAAFRAEHPQVRVDLVITPRTLDLARGEADIALRAAPLPNDPELISRRVAEARWGVYCSLDYARFHAIPRGPEDLSDHVVMMVDDPSGRTIAGHAPGAKAFETRETLNDLVIAARAGQGLVSLPCVLGHSLSDLRLCFVQSEPVTPIWLLHAGRLRGSAEVRALLDHVARQAAATRALFDGSEA